MLDVPSMEGLELGSEARMPFDACRPVTMRLAAGDTKMRLLNEPSIARVCMRLRIASWPNRSIVPLLSRLAVLARRDAECLALLGASAPCSLRRGTTMQPKSQWL